MEALALRRLTYQEFREMEFADDDPFQYELLDGELMKKSAPTPWHQRLSRMLLRAIDNHVTEKKLGEVFYAPIDVFLNDYNAPQPDLVYVSEAKKGLITNDGIMGVPDLVIEILSPSSLRRDRRKKMDIYERFAIPEYWIADPLNQSVEVYGYAQSGHYELVGEIAAVQDAGQFVITSNVLPDLSLDIRTMF